MELESLPDYRVDLATPSTFHAINEDDFEMLSELVMEVDDDFDEDEDDDDDMDEDDVDADDILSA